MKIKVIKKALLHFYLLPVLVGLVIFLLGFPLGVFDLPNSPSEKDIRFFNAGIAVPIIVTSYWLGIRYSYYKALLCLYRFARISDRRSAVLKVSEIIENKRKRNLKISVIVGIFMATFYLSYEGLLANDFDTVTVYMNIIALPFWTVLCMALLQLITITQTVIQHFLTLQKIQLFDIKKLMPISDLVIVNILITALLASVIPLFWMGKNIPDIDIIIGLFIFIGFAVFQFLPVIRVQQMVANNKALAIQRINLQYENQFTTKEIGSLSLIHDSEKLRQLSALINAKQEIASSSEWPLDISQGAKALLLSLSVPLSWAIGSLIETAISNIIA